MSEAPKSSEPAGFDHEPEPEPAFQPEADFVKGNLSIVPAPRPYSYRRPVGHPEADDTIHPLRRRSDFDPEK